MPLNRSKPGPKTGNRRRRSMDASVLVLKVLFINGTNPRGPINKTPTAGTVRVLLFSAVAHYLNRAPALHRDEDPILNRRVFKKREFKRRHRDCQLIPLNRPRSDANPKSFPRTN